MGFVLKMISENLSGKKYVSKNQPYRLYDNFEQAALEGKIKVEVANEHYIGNYCDFQVIEVADNPTIPGEIYKYREKIDWIK